MRWGGTIIVEDACLKLRPTSQKSEGGAGKARKHAFFKPKDAKVYVNARAHKSLQRKRGGTDTLEGGDLNPWPVPH